MASTTFYGMEYKLPILTVIFAFNTGFDGDRMAVNKSSSNYYLLIG